MQQEKISISGSFITLDKLLKFSGVADTGGQAFLMVAERAVKLNGKLVTEKRKKIFPGDKVRIADDIELSVITEAE